MRTLCSGWCQVRGGPKTPEKTFRFVNISISFHDEYIADRENPVFVDCANLTFSTSPGLPTAYVTYSLPNSMDNSGMVMQVNCFGVNRGGEELGIGVYDVTCVAEDDATLTAVCMFTITVEGKCRKKHKKEYVGKDLDVSLQMDCFGFSFFIFLLSVNV